MSSAVVYFCLKDCQPKQITSKLKNMSKSDLDLDILPMKLFDNDNIVVEIIICAQISGCQNYINNVSKTVTLKERTY